MTRVFLNGVRLIPLQANGEGDYLPGDIAFRFKLRGGVDKPDIVTVEKTFLGLHYSTRIYKVLRAVQTDQPFRPHAVQIG